MAGSTVAGVWRGSEISGPLTSHQGFLRTQSEIPQSSRIASSTEVQSQEPAPDAHGYIEIHKVLQKCELDVS